MTGLLPSPGTIIELPGGFLLLICGRKTPFRQKYTRKFLNRIKRGLRAGLESQSESLLQISVSNLHFKSRFQKRNPMRLSMSAASQAMKHCQNTMAAAQPLPSSRLIAATAAMQGV